MLTRRARFLLSKGDDSCIAPSAKSLDRSRPAVGDQLLAFEKKPAVVTSIERVELPNSRRRQGQATLVRCPKTTTLSR